MVEVAIDTASDIAGVALTAEGGLVSEVTWKTRQNHSRELLPAIEWLLQRAALSKSDISAVFVCTGPGSYAGLRVGLSTAKTLAYALGIPVAGIGRLEADAALVAAAPGSEVVAVHSAGRAEIAWARYAVTESGVVERWGPRLSPREEVIASIGRGDIVCGEPDEQFRTVLSERGVLVIPAHAGRVLAVARLGRQRLERGDVDSADALVPLYLREPAIGPQPPR